MILSNTQLTWISLREAARHFPTFIKNFIAAIVALFVFQFFLDQGVELLSSKFKSGENQSFALIISILLLTMFSEFFLNNAFLLLASKSFRASPQLLPSDLGDYQQMIIEEIRSAGKVLMGFLLFIFPGFNRLVDYFWVPFIVLFEDDYRLGKSDALLASKSVARGHFWFLSVVLFCTSCVAFAVDYVITRGESSVVLNRLPVLIAAVIGILLNLYFKLFYCALYRHSRNKARLVSEPSQLTT